MRMMRMLVEHWCGVQCLCVWMAGTHRRTSNWFFGCVFQNGWRIHYILHYIYILYLIHRYRYVFGYLALSPTLDPRNRKKSMARANRSWTGRSLRIELNWATLLYRPSVHSCVFGRSTSPCLERLFFTAMDFLFSFPATCMTHLYRIDDD